MKAIIAICAAIAGMAVAVPLASGGTGGGTGTTTTTPTGTTPTTTTKAPGHRHRRAGRRIRRHRVSRLALRACRAERRDPNFAAEHGGKTFAEFYGERPMRACRRAKGVIVRNAAQACRTERRADPAAFRQKYGTNPSRRNAFGKCVSQKARAGGL
jgi:hypothetical protein